MAKPTRISAGHPCFFSFIAKIPIDCKITLYFFLIVFFYYLRFAERLLNLFY